MADSDVYLLEAYEPPEWAADLQYTPKYRVKLAMTNTPIHKWKLPGIPDEFEVFIKRDDMTGCSLSGNKIRKLEFLLADAKHQGCDAVITCGRLRSNHCRTTAVASRQMGMDCHLMLRSQSSDVHGLFKGNTLLDRLVGCSFYLLPGGVPYDYVHQRMKELKEHLRNKSGKKSYFIPLGGSNLVGLFGYFECFKELLQQGAHERFTDVVITTGSGGSLAGLAISNYLTGSKLRIHAMVVTDVVHDYHEIINMHLKELGLQGEDEESGSKVISEDIIDIVREVVGRGYGLSTPDELESIDAVTRATGILLDPVYTGKATHHLRRLFRDQPGRFQGDKILFIHTGGTFNLFSENMESMYDDKSPAENRVYDWRKPGDNQTFDQ